MGHAERVASSDARGDGDGPLLDLLHAIASRDHDAVARRLDASPNLAIRSVRVGASRNGPDEYFLTAIRHHVYRGDTALHIAAAAYQPTIAALLLSQGAAVRARNRRGAEPLHYAADGSPGSAHWDPEGQRQVVELLIDGGADPNAFDNSGVAPLHRAVRTRSSQAVRALIDRGADPRLKNKRGSTPLHLAVQNTGRSNSGSGAAKEEQIRVIEVLLERGARSSETDANGKTVAAAASSEWIRDLLGPD
jgi:ankyrin repeat protein